MLAILLIIGIFILFTLFFQLIVNRVVIPRSMFLGAHMGGDHSNQAYKNTHNITMKIDNKNLDTYTVGTGKKLIIYFHGNAGSINLIWKMIANEFHNRFPGCTVFIYDYRGFGFSDGSPTLENTLSDALEITKRVILKHKPEKTFLYGRSLGGAIALHTCASLNTSKVKLVLETPFIGTRYVKMGKVVQTYCRVAKDRFCCVEPYETCLERNIDITVMLAGNDSIVDSTRIETFFKRSRIELFPGLSHNHVFEDSKWLKVMRTII